jgi:hypothetical protein
MLRTQQSARRVAAALCCAFTVATSGAQARLTKEDADRFQTKVTRIEQFAAKPARPKAGQTIQVTDSEVNSYLKFLAGRQVPVGVVEPTINGLGGGRMFGRAVVDLDVVRTQKKRGWTDPLAYLTGRLPVTASGVLTTQNGVGRFELQAAAISGVTIPKGVLQELLSFYSRTPEKPSGINMDDPFALPSRIREIRVGQGAATIVQ